ncbi:MAG: YkgJ family cysteine cluster protein, partial [Lachnospiraceae bacterium]|nr:YkgJ family cysteine cluster protein [Lachnospiraceae bacterium]
MERNIDMKEVSDGKLYTSNDMVKADCGGCEGCSACCRGMGESIVLDPLDIHRLCCGLGTDFNGLMVDKIELN